MSELQTNLSGVEEGQQTESSAKGSYGAPQQNTPPPPAAPQAAPRVRRVGTLTMGIALILTGCAIAASLIWPSFDLTIVFRLCPLLLISLGCEVLVSSFARGNIKLKYDLVSMFFCSILIVLSLCLSMVPLAVRYFGPEYRLSEKRIEDELDRASYQLLRADAAVADCSADVSLFPLSSQPASSAQELREEDEVRFSVDLRGPYTDPAAFAADCVRVRDILMDGSASPDSLFFTAAATPTEGGQEGFDELFTLSLSGPFQLHQSAEELTALVETY